MISILMLSDVMTDLSTNVDPSLVLDQGGKDSPPVTANKVLK
jgi:hypothetical protein